MINGKAGFLHLDISIRETTLRGYSEPLRDLNIDRLPFSHLKVSNGRWT